MTLDEAITHAMEVAENQEECADRIDKIGADSGSIRECAKEHRQLAEWLRELKEYKEGIVTCGHCKHIGTNTCYYCMFHYSNYFEDEEVKDADCD